MDDLIQIRDDIKRTLKNLKTANFKDTYILLDLYYPTTIQDFTPAESGIEVTTHRNNITGKPTHVTTGNTNDEVGSLSLLYSDYIALKKLKLDSMSLKGHTLVISEKIGDMIAGAIRTEGLIVSDMEAINIYYVLITNVIAPSREVDSESMIYTLEFVYLMPLAPIEASIPSIF